MEIRPIKTEEDYRTVLTRFYELFDAPAGSPENDEAQILSLIINNYDNEHYPIDPPDPIEAIKIRMADLKIRQIDLINALGGKNRVSEILNRKRKLTIEMIRNLSRQLGISVDVLIRDYEIKP